MSPRTARLAALGFALFIGLPLLLGLAGVTPQLNENRFRAEFPDLAPAELIDAATYTQLNRYLSDRLPLRDKAIEADAYIDLELFRDNPNPGTVAIGEDGWLFLVASWEKACSSEEPVADMVGRLRLAERIVTASGRDFRLVVAPDKVSIYPDKLGEAIDDLPTCERERRGELHRLLQGGAVEGFVDLWGPFQEKAAAGEELYYRGDTHWNQAGAAAFVEQLVESFRPGLWDPSAVVTTPDGGQTGGLRGQIGLPKFEKADRVMVARAGVRITSIEEWSLPQAQFVEEVAPEEFEFLGEAEVEMVTDPAEAQLVVTGDGSAIQFVVPHVGRSRWPRRIITSAGPPLVEGRVVFLQDSFMWDPLEMIPQYFAESVFDHWKRVDHDLVRADFREADAIVVQTVERLVWQRSSQQPLLDTLLISLAGDLPGFDLDLAAAAEGFSSGGNGGLVADHDRARLELADIPAPADAAHRFLLVRIFSTDEPRPRATVADATGTETTTATSLPQGFSTMVIDLGEAIGSETVTIRPRSAGTEIVSIRVVDVP